ncbi:restriction endonuclease subunit S [Streptococcus suis]|uniref:restriction endonuclease subunit S n=1 Tax=Streptococcus suis TaxID=1307 RepID=UPI002FC98578
MKTNNNIPAYRFQGYTDAWELRKLGEVGTVAMCRRIFKEQTSEHGEIPFYKIGTFGGTPDAFIARELFEEFKDKYSYPNIGDILISASGSIGRTVEFLGEDEYFQDSNIVWLKHDGKINNIFLKQFYSIVKWSGIEGSTIKRLYNENILNTEISLPTLPEQKAIGTFFSTLDRHITLHQRKLDTLKEQKKTYLKLLFPAKGQTKPALRFQGFEDDWEEVKLGEVLVEYNKKSEIENQFELLSSTNSGIEPRSGRVSGESNIGYKIIKRGMVVLSPQNLWLGNINYNAKFEIGIVSPSYKVFNIYGPNELFLATVLRLPQMFFEYAQASVQGASIVRRNLDLDLFGSILVPLPTLSEQEAIGTFFQTLDQELAQVEDKLASLKEMKKTLLRKLFV